MKIRPPLFALLVLASLAHSLGCSRESRAGEDSPAAQHVKNAVSELQKAYDDARPTIDKDLEDLKARASSASEAARAEIEKALADLEPRRKALAEKFEELKTRAPAEAQAMLEKLKADLDALEKSASDAADRSKQEK
jgi:Skp family chaperone for outer membrane proteins